MCDLQLAYRSTPDVFLGLCQVCYNLALAVGMPLCIAAVAHFGAQAANTGPSCTLKGFLKLSIQHAECTVEY